MPPQVSGEAMETGLEIVEDLVEMITFQKLSYAPRFDSNAVPAGNGIVNGDVPKVRGRRARTVASHSKNVHMETRESVPNPRPRIHSQDSSNLDNRRKRSFSMCESDEDDELASLSSSASYQSAPKHQKLHDYDTSEEHPQYLASDSIFVNSSLSSTSMSSSTSSMSTIPHPTAVRMAMPRVSFPTSACHCVGGLHTPSCAATPSSSSPRSSSPRSGPSSPRSGPPRALPSVFKRAQSDGEVLLRNSAAHRDSLDCPASPAIPSVRHQPITMFLDAFTLRTTV
jgi:hypothetical protein